ncbi:nitroreductase [Methanofollis aquaemaris]|uniref:Nitroreductase n=1 Tax=Methanofollis aquaemaris TaxID=126734 RepID=A0A8A3S866_9EURY|nr:nitroreductase family protein [Methanofollis aquaemaris]QSZ68123.1 nitroreductase [Methanofollis aquaemaris]
MDSSEFLTFLEGRQTVREYDPDREVTEEEAEFILRAASSAPSAGNREAWDVVVVRAEDQREALAETAFDQAQIRNAPVVFVVCSNYVRSMSRYGDRGILYALEDATIACTYMMLAAHALRLHACWTGAFEEDSAREVLNIPPHIRPVALLAVGRGEVPAARTERMPVGEHVHRETW